MLRATHERLMREEVQALAWGKVEFMTNLYRQSLRATQGANKGLARLQRRIKMEHEK